MELYKCFSCLPVTGRAFAKGWDDYVSDELNDRINRWAAEMKAKHPKFRYRILSADSVGNSNPRNIVNRENIYTFIHVLYEVD